MVVSHPDEGTKPLTARMSTRIPDDSIVVVLTVPTVLFVIPTTKVLPLASWNVFAGL